ALRQLAPVAGRVEDVQYPDRAVQLHGRADLDAGLRQPLPLRLDAVDVDSGHTTLVPFRGLALRQRDFGRAAVERDPLPLVVGERLGEAEQLLIERARPVEVADVVPDSHSIKAGSSRNSFRLWRKPAAGAPSTAR